MVLGDIPVSDPIGNREDGLGGGSSQNWNARILAYPEKVVVGGGDLVQAYSIWASCCVAFRRTLAARKGALTSEAFFCRQMARAIIDTQAMMPIRIKNLNNVAG